MREENYAGNNHVVHSSDGSIERTAIELNPPNKTSGTTLGVKRVDLMRFLGSQKMTSS